MRPADVILVAAGAAVGGTLRYTLGGAMLARWGEAFPWHTFVVNVTGAFLIGLVAALSVEGGAIPPAAGRFLGAGVLGGYTTFSTLALESMMLAQRGAAAGAVLNLVGTGVAGLAAVALGLFLGRML